MQHTEKRFISWAELNNDTIIEPVNHSNTKSPSVKNMLRGHFQARSMEEPNIYHENHNMARVEINGEEAYLKRVNCGFMAGEDKEFFEGRTNSDRFETAVDHMLNILSAE